MFNNVFTKSRAACVVEIERYFTLDKQGYTHMHIPTRPVTHTHTQAPLLTQTHTKVYITGVRIAFLWEE